MEVWEVEKREKHQEKKIQEKEGCKGHKKVS